jgi:hypothetical protein
MITETKHLVSGYAAEILTADQRREVFSAALEDQEIFDQLFEEESWRQIFQQPGVRRELLAALQEPSSQPAGYAGRFFQWLRDPFPVAPPRMRWAAATAFAMLVAVVFLQPGGPGVLPEEELVPKGGAIRSGGAVESPLTRGPSQAGILEVSYTMELREEEEESSFRVVSPDYNWQSGDRFRLRLEGNAEVWTYLFSRASDEDVYVVLNPVMTAGDRVRRLQDGGLVLPDGDWLLEMDETPDDEHLLLVVTTAPWPSGGLGLPATDLGELPEIPAARLDAELEAAEARLASLSWRRSVAEERVSMEIAEVPDDLVLVVRVLAPGRDLAIQHP